jgi:penicillin-binding protein 2
LKTRLAILAVAAITFFAGSIRAAGPTNVSRTTTLSSHRSQRHLSHRRLHRRRTSASRMYRRGVRRQRSLGMLSSWGQPAALDNPAGEDPLIRQAAEEALGNWNGAIVVVDPNNGRILSMVNQKLALSGAFTPCSTFKPVVALAALKERLITPETRLRVWGPHGGRITLKDALAHSNNMFFAKLGEMLGFRRVAEYAREFGLGEPAGWELKGENPGVFPAAPPKVGGVGLLTSFGQGIQITALQLAAIVSAIANGGTLYYLQYPRTPDQLMTYEPRVKRKLFGFEAYFPDVIAGMAAAVLYGTARPAFSPEENIFGKTGTCSENGAHLGWFASFSADQHPKYVAVVLLRGGRMMFGPHAAEIAGQFYRTVYEKEKLATQASRFSLPALIASPVSH